MDNMNQTATTMEEEYEPDKAHVKKWAAFVESDAVNFLTGYKLEKMTIEDGNGNKAKFTRTKDGGLKIDYTSSVLL